MLALAWLSCPVHALSRIQADNWRHRLNYLRFCFQDNRNRVSPSGLSPYRHHARVILLTSTPYAQGSLTTDAAVYISFWSDCSNRILFTRSCEQMPCASLIFSQMSAGETRTWGLELIYWLAWQNPSNWWRFPSLKLLVSMRHHALAYELDHGPSNKSQVSSARLTALR